MKVGGTKAKQSKLFQWQQRARTSDEPCAKCGRVGYATVDHIVPMSFIDMLGLKKETYDDEWNFQFLCRACNLLKANRLDFSNPKTLENLRRYIDLAELFYFPNGRGT